MGMYLLLDPDGRVNSAVSSNLEPEGSVEVSAETFLIVSQSPRAFRYLPLSETLEEVVEPPPPPPIPVISDRQFAQGLAHRQIITNAEAIAWAARGELPAALSGFLDSLSGQERFDAEITLSSATEFRRDHPLVDIIGATHGMSSADIDDFWRYCGSLP